MDAHCKIQRKYMDVLITKATKSIHRATPLATFPQKDMYTVKEIGIHKKSKIEFTNLRIHEE